MRDAQVRETLAESYFGEIALLSRFLQVHDAGPLPPPTMPRHSSAGAGGKTTTRSSASMTTETVILSDGSVAARDTIEREVVWSPYSAHARSAGDDEREQHSRRIIFGERALQSKFLEVHHDAGRLPSAGLPSSSATGLRKLYVDELASATASLRHRPASSASATGSQAGHPLPLTTATAQAAVSPTRENKMSEERMWKLSHT